VDLALVVAMVELVPVIAMVELALVVAMVELAIVLGDAADVVFQGYEPSALIG